MSNRRSRRRRKTNASESFTFGAGTVTRDGRIIAFERTSDEDSRRAAAEAFIRGAESSEAEQLQRHAKLTALMQEVGPFDLLARASATYLAIDPNTYKEWDDDRSIAHIEYIALQALA